MPGGLINFGSIFILSSFTTGHFACVSFVRKLTIFELNSWLSFQRLRWRRPTSFWEIWPLRWRRMY